MITTTTWVCQAPKAELISAGILNYKINTKAALVYEADSGLIDDWDLCKSIQSGWECVLKPFDHDNVTCMSSKADICYLSRSKTMVRADAAAWSATTNGAFYMFTAMIA